MHWDTNFLEKMYLLVLNIDNICSNKEARRTELFNLGWTLFFRSNKGVMMVHKSVFDVLMMNLCSSYFAFEDRLENVNSKRSLRIILVIGYAN